MKVFFSKILTLALIVIIFSCSNNENISNEHVKTIESQNNAGQFYSTTYDDGIFCAEVEYYNPRTGTNSTYTLTVELEDGRLVKIEWPNGGWLDESHYSGVEISDFGDASFESDRGYQYSLHIINSNACAFDSNFDSDEDN